MASDVTLREISQDTVTQIMALKVGPDQDHLMATNDQLIAEAHFAEDAWFRGYICRIYTGGVRHDIGYNKEGRLLSLEVHDWRSIPAIKFRQTSDGPSDQSCANSSQR